MLGPFHLTPEEVEEYLQKQLEQSPIYQLIHRRLRTSQTQQFLIWMQPEYDSKKRWSTDVQLLPWVPDLGKYEKRFVLKDYDWQMQFIDKKEAPDASDQDGV